jgi:3-oxoacyl-[acyl-carrier protein] reductase
MPIDTTTIRRDIMDLQLKDKTALVTGASVGIGRGIAKALAAEGVKLAISARRADKLQEVADEIVAAGGHRPVIIESDLYPEDAAAKLTAAAIQGLGHVDILVNNAGGSRSFKDLHVSEEAWQEAITLNFHRPRQVADALVDQMIARKWGRIINITGKSEPDHVNGAFCAKAGIHSWAKGLSRMVGPHGITVNCIPPGRIHSEQIFRNYTPEYRQWQCENEIPMGRYGEPEDMANLVTFLSSPLASYITGAVIPVDGGLRRYQF